MPHLKTVSEGMEESFRKGLKLLLSLSNEQMEKILKIQETKQFSQIMFDKSLEKDFISEISRAVKLSRDKSAMLLDTIVNMELVDKEIVQDLTDDMKTVGLKQKEIEKAFKIV